MPGTIGAKRSLTRYGHMRGARGNRLIAQSPGFRGRPQPLEDRTRHAHVGRQEPPRLRAADRHLRPAGLPRRIPALRPPPGRHVRPRLVHRRRPLPARGVSHPLPGHGGPPEEAGPRSGLHGRRHDGDAAEPVPDCRRAGHPRHPLEPRIRQTAELDTRHVPVHIEQEGGSAGEYGRIGRDDYRPIEGAQRPFFHRGSYVRSGDPTGRQ